MALHVGDEVFVTRINSADRKVMFEGKERVTVKEVVNSSSVKFIFQPDIGGHTYFSCDFGDTYEEISEIKVGDVVRVIGGRDYHYVPIGAERVVLEVVGYDVIVSQGTGLQIVNKEDVELVKEPAKPKTTKFKVGDRLKQVKEGNSPSSLGQIIEITKIDPDDENQFYSANNCGWTTDYLEENFELLKDDIEKESRWYGKGVGELLGEDGANIYSGTYHCCPPSVEYVTSKTLELYKSLTNKKMETTKSIVEFAKNLTLSKEEKLLRKANLKDSDGDWTNEARHIVKQKRAKEFGYKSWDEMTENLGEDGVSAIEYAQLFKKYKDELIKIATEFEKENKKK